MSTFQCKKSDVQRLTLCSHLCTSVFFWQFWRVFSVYAKLWPLECSLLINIRTVEAQAWPHPNPNPTLLEPESGYRRISSQMRRSWVQKVSQSNSRAEEYQCNGLVLIFRFCSNVDCLQCNLSKAHTMCTLFYPDLLTQRQHHDRATSRLDDSVT